MSGSIYTIDEVASELLGKPDAGSLSESECLSLEACIANAEAAVCSFLKQNIGFEEVTQVLTVTDDLMANPLLPAIQMTEPRRAVYLGRRPIQAASLTVWANHTEQTFADEHLLVLGQDYQLEDTVEGLSFSGVLRRLGSLWPGAPGGVKVTYTGGLDVLQSPEEWDAVKRATSVTIRQEYAKAQVFQKFVEDGGAGVLSEEDIGTWRGKFDSRSASKVLFNSQHSLPPEAIWYLDPLISYSNWL